VTWLGSAEDGGRFGLCSSFVGFLYLLCIGGKYLVSIQMGGPRRTPTTTERATESKSTRSGLISLQIDSIQTIPTSRMKTPQCHMLKNRRFAKPKYSPVVSSSAVSSSATAAPAHAMPTYSNLLNMPDDVLFQILLHCGPVEVDESVKLVCRRLQ
jgi:hypothetical protein